MCGGKRRGGGGGGGGGGAWRPKRAKRGGGGGGGGRGLRDLRAIPIFKILLGRVGLGLFVYSSEVRSHGHLYFLYERDADF